MSRTMKTRLFALLSAIIYLLLGGMILMNPGATLSSLILVMGIFLLIAGVFLIVDGIQLSSFVPYKAAYIFDGILLLLIGFIFTFGNTYINIVALSYMLVIWFIASAIIQIYFVWPIGGWITVVSIILNMFVIIMSLFALSDPVIAQGILIWYLAFQFILFGINRLLVVFDSRTNLE